MDLTLRRTSLLTEIHVSGMRLVCTSYSTSGHAVLHEVREDAGYGRTSKTSESEQQLGVIALFADQSGLQVEK